MILVKIITQFIGTHKYLSYKYNTSKYKNTIHLNMKIHLYRISKKCFKNWKRDVYE